MHRDQLIIAEPCHVDWETMTGDDRRRFCGQCRKHVHDLNQLTEREAETLLGSSDDLCVQYRSRSDGTVPFRSARTGLRVAATALLLASTPAFASGQATDGPSWLQTLKAWWTRSAKPVQTETRPMVTEPEQTEETSIPELQTVHGIPTPVSPEPPPVRGRVAFHPPQPPTAPPVVKAENP